MSGVRVVAVEPEDADLRLDRWFKKHFPGLPFARLQRALRKGEIRVDGKRAKADQRLGPGQSVRVPPVDADPPKPACAPRVSDADAAFARDLVFFCNDDVLALNKPAGLAVQGGSKTARHLDGMLDALRFGAPERPKLVHRLDRDTSGVLILARSRAAAARLGRAFKHKTARKVYWAVCVGAPSLNEGTIDLDLGKVAGSGGERVMAGVADGKRAISEFAVLERLGKRAAVVALWPRTGRTHQLRAHMAAIGCPILGDRKYGGAGAAIGGLDLPKGLHLHARALALPGLPVLSAPSPPAMLETFQALGADPASWPEDPFADA